MREFLLFTLSVKLLKRQSFGIWQIGRLSLQSVALTCVGRRRCEAQRVREESRTIKKSSSATSAALPCPTSVISSHRLDSLFKLQMIRFKGGRWRSVTDRGLAEGNDSLVFAFRLMSAVIFSLLKQAGLFTEGLAPLARVPGYFCVVFICLLPRFCPAHVDILANQPIAWIPWVSWADTFPFWLSTAVVHLK